MHESGNGTFQTCRVGLTMSVDGGKADLAFGRIGTSLFAPSRSSSLPWVWTKLLGGYQTAALSCEVRRLPWTVIRRPNVLLIAGSIALDAIERPRNHPNP